MTTITLAAHMSAMEADALREFREFVMNADEEQVKRALFGPAAQAAKKQTAKKRKARRGIGSY